MATIKLLIACLLLEAVVTAVKIDNNTKLLAEAILWAGWIANSGKRAGG